MSRRTKYSYELRKEILRHYYSHNILLRATAVYTSNINVSISEINYLFSQFAFEKKKAVF